jgi:hypothetical protein
LVTGEARLQVQGTLSERADRVLANGVELGELQWRDNTFTGLVGLQVGNNEIRIEAQKRFRKALVEVLAITRLGPTTLRLLPPCRDGDSTDQATYALAVSADEGTTRVVARCGGKTIALSRDSAASIYRGQVPLAAGANVIVVEAVNSVDAASSLELRVERTGAAARPVITAVAISVAGKAGEVPKNGEVFATAAGALRITSSDPAATVKINGKDIVPAADGSIDLLPLLAEGSDTAMELRLQNAFGVSDAFRWRQVVDATPPAVEISAPKNPVQKGKVFELRGTWVDPGNLKSVAVGQVVGEITPGRGRAKRGEWVVRMPPIETTTDLKVVVEDCAGNRRELPVRVEVQ